MNLWVRQTSHPSLIEALWPRADLKQTVALILAGSWLVALTAQITIPLQPVPVTGQTFGVLLVGALLGSRRGALAMLAYLTQGAMGLPVFAGGTSGLARLAGPTGGYLLGFVIAAFLVGSLSERGWDRHFIPSAMAMLIGNAAIYALGLPWLATFTGWEAAFRAGLLPFIPGDLAKIALAALALPGAWSWLRATTETRSGDF